MGRIKENVKKSAVILHISADYPDAMAPQKTKAVSNLVEGTPEYRHVVYSINRVNGWSGIEAIDFGADRIAVSYRALPKGVLWEKRLPELAAWIARDMEKRGIVPDLIEAHKFTVEGIIGHKLAQIYGCPLVCDIQGASDTNILRRKKGLREKYKTIGKDAAVIFPYAPWAIEPFEKLISLNRHKCRTLPVVPGFDDCTPAPLCHEDKMVSVFHLDAWKRKNFEGLVAAAKIMRSKRPGFVLHVYGRGSAKTILAMKDIIRKEKMDDCVYLKGPVAHVDLRSVLQSYAGFVLASKQETYGLVYAESLFCGIPVVFNKDQAISGYFDPSVIGYGCDPGNVEDIAAGMEHILAHQAQYKENIAKLQADGGLDILKKENILQVYRSGLEEALEKGRKAPSVYRKEEKICFAASGGGHLRQLLQLSPLRDEYPNYYFLTEKTPLGESLVKDHRAVFVPHFAFGQRKTEGLWPFLKSGISNSLSSTYHFFREWPDVIISTGAGAAFCTLVWGKIFRRKIIYIESIARVTEVSLFGKLATRLSGLILVQWPSMVERMPGAQYCSPFIIEDLKGRAEREGVLVTVGTVMPFDRMVRGVECLLQSGVLSGPGAAQIGESSEKFEGISCFSGCSFEELNARMERADIVICHGGSGSILGALKAGAHVVAMARKPEFKEHYDDHQKDITAAFEQMGLISVAKDENDLERAIAEAKSRSRRVVNIDPTAYVLAIRAFISGLEGEKAVVQSSEDKKAA